MRLLVSSWLVCLVGCGPGYVETPAEVDNDILQGNFEEACYGLRAEHPEVRRHTAEKLAEHPDQPIATQCTCVALYDPESGRVDTDIARGLDGKKRDDLATCLTPAFADERVADKVGLAELVGNMKAEAGWALLANVAKSHADPAVRAGAVHGMRFATSQQAALIAVLGSDSSADVRAAAAKALGEQRTPESRAALEQAAGNDAEAAVRIAAVLAMKNMEGFEAAACRVLNADADPGARHAAAIALEGIRKKDVVVPCFHERLIHEEPSEEVRAQVLKNLVVLRMPEANQVLCDDIGPYLRLYVKDAVPPEGAAWDILKAQNDVDFENSYACVEKAMRQGGYSCYAKYHLATWNAALGGKAKPRACPGMAVAGGGGGGGGEISFE